MRIQIFLLVYTLVAFFPAAHAQAPSSPVIYPRGVVNGITMSPAPATIARGGVVHIKGFNLGPAGDVTASENPLPTTLGNPPVQALINGTAVPLFSISSSLIVAQVPWDAALGQAQVVVTRGGVQSSPVSFTIALEAPAIRTAAGSGYGTAGTLSGRTLQLSASGLGPTDPPIASGAPGRADSPVRPVNSVRAYVGGMKADVTAALSTQRVGEFDVQIALPPGARSGDAITLQVSSAGGLLSANRGVFQGLQNPDVQYVPFPDGAPAAPSLTSSDLNGNYVLATSAADSQGCSIAFLFDMAAKTVNKPSECLLSSNFGATTVAANDGNVLGALIGPAAADGGPDTAGSSRAILFNPSLSSPLSVSLPSPATSLLSSNGTLAAFVSGSTPQVLPIDSETGAVGDPISFGGGQGGGGAFALAVDVDGLSRVLSTPAALGQGQIGLILADNDTQPTRAEFVALDASGKTVLSKSFPDGWLPLVAPQAPSGGAGGFPGGPPPPGGFPGGPLPGGGVPGAAPAGGAIAAIGRTASYYDGSGRVFYALARTTDNSTHGFVSFTLDSAPAAAIPFPNGAYAAACSPSIGLFSLTLSRRVVIAAGAARDIAFRSPCQASGFIELNLTDQSVSVIPAAGQAQFDASLTSFSAMNDYVYGTNASSSGAASSLVVLDGAGGSAFRMDLPQGVRSFSGLQQAADIGVLVATGTNSTSGDAGFVVFDLGNQTVNTIPIPNGIASMSLVNLFPATRKLVAQGIRTGGSGSQILLFDMVSGNLTIVPNPNGVAFAGAAPSSAGSAAPTRSLIGNLKANTAAAIALDAAGKQIGVMVVRIP